MINGTDNILVCCGTGCIANGALGVADAIQAELDKRGLTGVPDQAYATAIGLFNSVINVVLLIIANTTSKRFSENSLW